MTEENNKLSKPSAVADMFKPKKYGIAAKREQAQKIISELNPDDMPNKLAIIFDDSGSMASQDKIKEAHTGVRNFTTQCNPRDTAIAVFPLNVDKKPITCNFDLLNVLVSTIRPTGGTPLYAKTQEMLNDSTVYTRGILFSDGQPTDRRTGYGDEYATDKHEQTIALALEKKIPLDTVYIGIANTSGYDTMKDIAERTGGIFVHFTDAASLASNLKYLAPALRGILMNAELKAKIERGESI